MVARQKVPHIEQESFCTAYAMTQLIRRSTHDCSNENVKEHVIETIGDPHWLCNVRTGATSNVASQVKGRAECKCRVTHCNKQSRSSTALPASLVYRYLHFRRSRLRATYTSSQLHPRHPHHRRCPRRTQHALTDKVLLLLRTLSHACRHGHLHRQRAAVFVEQLHVHHARLVVVPRVSSCTSAELVACTLSPVMRLPLKL